MKKIIALLLAVVMVAAMFAGCQSSNTDTTAPKDNNTDTTTAPKENKTPAFDARVAMITDYGDITDQSFNQTTWEAVVKFGQDNNIETKYYKPTTNDTAGRVASVELAIAEGYNVLVMPGYAFGGTIVEIASEYPDVKFIALDVAAGDLLEAGVAAAG